MSGSFLWIKVGQSVRLKGLGVFFFFFFFWREEVDYGWVETINFNGRISADESVLVGIFWQLSKARERLDKGWNGAEYKVVAPEKSHLFSIFSLKTVLTSWGNQ